MLVQDRKTKGYFALKSMKIVDLIRLKQQQHVHNEKEVLMEVNYPFIVKLWVLFTGFVSRKSSVTDWLFIADEFLYLCILIYADVEDVIICV